MGFWGFKLYENDTSLDVRDNFEKLFNEGKKVEDITNKLAEDYKCITGDVQEELAFWFALADTQWEYGVLLPYVKEKVLFLINDAGRMIDLKITDTAKKTQMIRTLEDLQAKLLSPQPLVKKIRKKRVYKCQWKIGDTFAYRLESDLAKEIGFYGRYFLIQKIDESVWYPGHIVPIVYVKITNGTDLPSNTAEYNQLEFIQTSFTKYEERFFPIDMSRPREDIAEKSLINYEVDEYGFLPEYRIVLLNTSKKIIPSNLIYLGNFMDATCPQNEFIPHSKHNISNVSWKNFDQTFEKTMIDLYYGHNLRRLKIYNK